MICHYFFQGGWGFSLDQLVIIYVVLIGFRREGGKPNLQVFTKDAFFYLKAPLSHPFEAQNTSSCLVKF